LNFRFCSCFSLCSSVCAQWIFGDAAVHAARQRAPRLEARSVARGLRRRPALAEAHSSGGGDGHQLQLRAAAAAFDCLPLLRSLQRARRGSGPGCELPLPAQNSRQQLLPTRGASRPRNPRQGQGAWLAAAASTSASRPAGHGSRPVGRPGAGHPDQLLLREIPFGWLFFRC